MVIFHSYVSLPEGTIWTHLVLCKDRPFPIDCVCERASRLLEGTNEHQRVLLRCWKIIPLVERCFVPGVTMVNQFSKNYRTFSWKHHYFGEPTFHHCVHASGLEHEIPNRRHRGATRLGNEAFLLRVQRIKISALEDFSPLASKVCQKLPKRHIKKCGTRKTHKNTSNYQWENMGKSSVGHVFVWFDLKFGRVYGRYLQFRFMKWPPDHR